MSDALVTSLSNRVSALETEKAQLNAALSGVRKSNKALKAELEKANGQVAELGKDRDGWKGKAEAGPGQKDARIKELEGSIALRDHRDTFRSEALAAGVKPASVDDLYQLLGLKPGESPAKAGDFADALTSAREARSWAFGEAPDSGQKPGAAARGGSQAVELGAAKAPPAGGGRGESVQTPSTVKYHREDVRKPGWQTSNTKLAEALAAGTAVCVDA